MLRVTLHKYAPKQQKTHKSVQIKSWLIAIYHRYSRRSLTYIPACLVWSSRWSVGTYSGSLSRTLAARCSGTCPCTPPEWAPASLRPLLDQWRPLCSAHDKQLQVRQAGKWERVARQSDKTDTCLGFDHLADVVFQRHLHGGHLGSHWITQLIRHRLQTLWDG